MSLLLMILMCYLLSYKHLNLQNRNEDRMKWWCDKNRILIECRSIDIKFEIRIGKIRKKIIK